MAVEDFNPERLKHIKGQEGRVDDQEKAERRAQEEDFRRDVDQEYKEYLADQNAFPTTGQCGMFIVSQYRGLAQRGAAPEFLEKAAEITAEKEGALFEFGQSLAGNNDRELRNELRYLRYQDIFCERSFEADWKRHG